MQERVRELIEWGRTLGLEYTRTRASLAAGGLAYFVALSLAPAALAFGTVAGIFLNPVDVRDVLERLAGRTPETASAIQPFIDALVSTVENASASSLTITTVVSVLVAVYASSKVVYSLRMAMNTVFGIEENRSGLFERAVSAVATLVGLVAAVAVVVALTVVPRILQWLGVTNFRLSTGSGIADWIVVLGVAFLVVRYTLIHAPNTRQQVPWNSLGVGVGALGILGVTAGLGVYARFSSSLSAAVLIFGTAVVILLWLYLCFVALMWAAIIEADSVRRRTTSADPQSAP